MWEASSSSSITIDGEVVKASSRDYIALTCGVLAGALGVIALLGALKETDQRGLRVGVVAIVLVLALFQLLRGVGVV